jgi:hypothetical protein
LGSTDGGAPAASRISSAASFMRRSHIAIRQRTWFVTVISGDDMIPIISRLARVA